VVAVMRQTRQSGPVLDALKALKPAFISTGVLSGVISVLMLSGSLFMLQVYDRVLPSGSGSTLLALVVLVVALYAFQSAIEQIRARLFARIGRELDLKLSPLAFDLNLWRGLRGDPGQGSAFRDIEQIRGFLSSGVPSALFDMPWTPLYVLLLFLLHPWMGLLSLVGLVALSAIAWLNERGTRTHQQEASKLTYMAGALAESARRNAETVLPLGMSGPLGRAWSERNLKAGQAVMAASDAGSRYTGVSRFVRLSLQSLMLALGAILVIQGKASGGVMFASSILLGRALSPVEMAIGHWRSFVGARQGYERLEAALVAAPVEPGLVLPRPSRTVQVQGLAIAAPGARAPFVRNVSFELQAGDAMGVIGPSGSGKSTLARAMAGAWPTVGGVLQLDGSTLDQWSMRDRGAFLGYLPQTVELFSGTIAQNIARFHEDARDEDILAAAAAARIDDLIRRLPGGFDAQVGEGGGLLPAGLRQRIGLARALYGSPFLVILDEPNSALDTEGDMALTQAIQDVRLRGGVVIIVAHRHSAIQAANKVLVMADGLQRAFGPRGEVLNMVLAPQQGDAPLADSGSRPVATNSEAAA
jgi:PrtD family type I secretion system ABC transporter